MKRISLFVLLLFLGVGLVSAEEFIFDNSLYAASDLDVKIDLGTDISVSGDVSRLEAKLFYYPQDFDSQEVRSFQSTPEYEEVDDYLLFKWRNPGGLLDLSYATVVTSEYNFPRIRAPISFPYEYITPELNMYLQSEEIIQLTPDIERQASILVGDEEDAVQAVFLIGKWVKNNIEYDLNTVTAEASQTSQWVLDNREGVCDELTSLFIAMVRSQGIPARFISGIAYTNLETLDSNWGPHGWAEVWIPGTGWVPYDVTYGQYGYVDATHIVFMQNVDAKNNAVEYLMSSRGGNFEPGPLVRTTQLVRKGEQRSADFNINIDVALSEVGFGSYNRIDVEVKNPYTYYVSQELFLAQTSKLYTDDYSISLLLGPKEETTIHWIARVDNQLDAGFKYTFPVVVYTNANKSYETTFTATNTGYKASKQELDLSEPTTAKTLPGEFSCEYPKTVNQGETFSITCTFDRPARICLKSCLWTETLTEEYLYDQVGIHTIAATVRDGTQSQKKILNVYVKDEPELNLTLDSQTTIGVANEGTITIRVEKTSFSAPEEATLTLQHPLFNQEWKLEALEKPSNIEVHYKGNQLHGGENTITATLTYNNKELTETTTITPTPNGLGERITLWLNSVIAWFAELA